MRFGDYNFNDPEWKSNKLFMNENAKKAEFCGKFIQSMIDEIARLNKELDEANAENAKSIRVRKAEAERDAALKDKREALSCLSMGITKEEIEESNKWWKDHTREERLILEAYDRPIPKAFHKVSYKIIPTELGTLKEAICSCGEIFRFD